MSGEVGWPVGMPPFLVYLVGDTAFPSIIIWDTMFSRVFGVGTQVQYFLGYLVWGAEATCMSQPRGAPNFLGGYHN